MFFIKVFQKKQKNLTTPPTYFHRKLKTLKKQIYSYDHMLRNGKYTKKLTDYLYQLPKYFQKKQFKNGGKLL